MSAESDTEQAAADDALTATKECARRILQLATALAAEGYTADAIGVAFTSSGALLMVNAVGVDKATARFIGAGLAVGMRVSGAPRGMRNH